MPKSLKRQRSNRPPPPDAAAAAERVRELLNLAGHRSLIDRLRELAARQPGGTVALVEALAAARSQDAGKALATVANEADEPEVRKAARRGLHRLRAAGVVVQLPNARPSRPPAAITDRAQLSEAHATPPDGTGSRALWLVLDRALGGVSAFGLVLNDSQGMQECSYRETTRRKFAETLRAWREDRGLTTVVLPPEYAASLVSEALALNAETGNSVPTEFQVHSAPLGELPAPPEGALIHQHVSRGQALLLPDLLERSDRLLDEEEMKGWFFNYEQSLPLAQDLARARDSRIALAGESREAREQRVVEAAITQLFTPTTRRSIRRRLEETAYVFWVTERQRSARQAVAAAFALGEGSLTRHPLARAMVLRTLELAIERERGTPAAT